MQLFNPDLESKVRSTSAHLAFKEPVDGMDECASAVFLRTRLDPTEIGLFTRSDPVGVRFELTMTTAHDHTVSADGSWTDGDDTITKAVGHHSHLATGATHSTQGGQR